MSNTDSGSSLMDYDFKMAMCDWCNGTGIAEDGEGDNECCECEGKGEIEVLI